MKGRWRSLGGSLLLAAASVALVLLLAEGALRLLARPPKAGKEQRERNRYTEYDPVLGWKKRPSASVVYDRPEYHVEYRVNSLGLRGPERPYAKPAGVARVLALGDSFVEAFMVDEPRTLTSRLEAELLARGCRAEVINGGTVGYGTDQEYLFFRDEGRKYAPDVALIFVYHNDIPYLVEDRYTEYPKPVLDFSTHPPTVRNQPVPRYQPSPAPAPPRAPPAAPRSHLLELVKDRIERTSARSYDRLAALGLWEPLRQFEMNDELRLFRVPELGHLRPAWSALTWTLETLAKEAGAAGGRLAIAYVPSRAEVSGGVWEATQVRYRMDEREYDRHAVAKRVGFIAGRLGVPMLDLTPPLADANRMFAPTYFESDSHWNARGQGVAARALAAFIAGGLLPGCP